MRRSESGSWRSHSRTTTERGCGRRCPPAARRCNAGRPPRSAAGPRRSPSPCERGRADRLVTGEIALVTLVPERPELARRIPIIGEVLGKRLHRAERVAGGGERRVVVAVDENDGHVVNVPRAPKPSSGVPSELSRITGKSAGNVVPTVPDARASLVENVAAAANVRLETRRVKRRFMRRKLADRLSFGNLLFRAPWLTHEARRTNHRTAGSVAAAARVTQRARREGGGENAFLFRPATRGR